MHTQLGNLTMFDEVIPVYDKQTAIAFLLISHDKPQIDLGFTQTLTNIIAVAIENKRLAKLNLVQEIAKHDLNFATEVQRYLVPNLFEKNKHIQVHGIYMPHSQIGG
jgi:sigma-B regulation protein RsbU (phosphoserine phosphatase)